MRAKTLTLKRARVLRANMTPPEARMWVRLRTRLPGKPTFRRQHPEGPFILDFYCAEARLAVEIDGATHGVEGRPERDARRDAWLVARGIEVMRIPAAEVMADPDGVADGVVRYAIAKIGSRR